jgi:hypothetical protein
MDSNKIICRKCKGNHLTITCGRINKEIFSDKPPENTGYKGLEASGYKESESAGGGYKGGASGGGGYKESESAGGGYKGGAKGGGGYKGGGGGGYKGGEDGGYKRQVNKVKIGSLPTDMTQEELSNLLYDWGNVTNIRVLNYDESSTAYVEFKDIKEVDYLVEALHRTPFDKMIITVEKLDQ